MAQRVLHVRGLPDAALDAAGCFHAVWVPQVWALIEQAGTGDDLALVFPRAEHRHQNWRLSAVQDLAREAAPVRINAAAGADDQAVAETLAYLAVAPGITGQVLAVDGNFVKMD